MLLFWVSRIANESPPIRISRDTQNILWRLPKVTCHINNNSPTSWIVQTLVNPRAGTDYNHHLFHVRRDECIFNGIAVSISSSLPPSSLPLSLSLSLSPHATVYQYSILWFRRWLYSHASIAVAFSDRNTGSLAGDLAETYFVLFMTKIESCIIWKGFSMCSNDKCFTEIQFYANN